MVAPLVGAWIEIDLLASALLSASVAPLVGAWIEIIALLVSHTARVVAPLVGAWIEITTLCYKTIYNYRRSPRGSMD